MFVDAIKKVNKAIFPIVTNVSGQPNGLLSFTLVGTGFLVNNKGNFVTASHVMSNPKTDYYRLVINNGKMDLSKLETLANDIESDVLIGQLNTNDDDFVVLNPMLTSVGRSVCIAGYVFGGIEKQYYQPTMVIDNDVKASITIQGFTRNYDGVLFSDPGISGLSGGPVFDATGVVIGMQVVTTSRSTKNLLISNGVAVKSMLICTLLEQSNIDFKLVTDDLVVN